MRRFAVVTVLVVGSVCLSGCLIAPVIPPAGMVYTGYSAPLDLDYQATPTAGTKVGRASTMSVLGLVAWGDGSAEAAARAGMIQTIDGADYEYLNVLGVFQRYTTVVRGR